MLCKSMDELSLWSDKNSKSQSENSAPPFFPGVQVGLLLLDTNCFQRQEKLVTACCGSQNRDIVPGHLAVYAVAKMISDRCVDIFVLCDSCFQMSNSLSHIAGFASRTCNFIYNTTSHWHWHWRLQWRHHRLQLPQSQYGSHRGGEFAQFPHQVISIPPSILYSKLVR